MNYNSKKWSSYGEVFDEKTDFNVPCDFRELQACLNKNNNDLSLCKAQFAKFKEACEQKKRFIKQII